jgi:NitT/TauT family transport system permease protein
MQLPDTTHADLAGLDALELAGMEPSRSFAARLWSAAWPKLIALALAITAWQLVVWSHWRESFVLPGPRAVFSELRHLVTTGVFWHAIGNTMRRALTGYAFAVVIGSVIGLASVRIRTLRSAVGSLITGLQTMPSIAWFPLAIMLFKLSEGAIFFVVVIGAAPSIANGVLSGVDNIPPLLVRAGRVLGANGFQLYRRVVVPAALPGIVAGLKQGWAFAWRSLMAGELLVIIAHRPSIGARMSFAENNSDAAGLLAWMIVILTVGILVDAVFTNLDAAMRRRRGLHAVT